MRPETQLVVALSRTPVCDATRRRMRELLVGGIDWEAVLTLATQWQVEPTVFGNLRLQFPAAMGPVVLSRVASLEKRSRAYAVSRTLILTDLVKSLDRAGVPSVVLKGPAVAIAAYDDCSRRTFADADLLVRREHLGLAREVLLSRGYSAHFRAERESGLISGQHALEFSDSRTSVELHWTLLSRHLRFNLDIDDIWSDATTIECIGSQLKILSSEHLFLYLCAHGAKHEWALFRWICDIAQLADRLTVTQAERVMALAEKANAKRILALGLRLIRAIFGEEASPFRPAAFGSERETARLVAVVRARLVSDAVESRGLLPQRIAGIHHYMEPLTFWLCSRERISDRLACGAQFCFVPAAGDRSRGRLQRVFRPARLAVNALRRLTRAS